MTTPWEIAAVLFALAYLALAIRQSTWCWPAAIVSTSMYVFLMYRAALYMESALQFFYIAIAVYGWWHWAEGGPDRAPLRVSRWTLRQHAVAIAAVLAVAAVSGTLLARFSDAAFPYTDSFTTWGAVLTTWMVARKILENWLYWFVLDSISIYLYLSRELYLTAALFVIYLVLIVVGYRSWRKSLSVGAPAHA